MAAVQPKRAKPLPHDRPASPHILSSTTTVDEQYHKDFRKHRHRQTEKQRRERTKAAITALRRLCQAPSNAEQAVVLEHAIAFIESLQTELAKAQTQVSDLEQAAAAQTAAISDFLGHTTAVQNNDSCTASTTTSSTLDLQPSPGGFAFSAPTEWPELDTISIGSIDLTLATYDSPADNTHDDAIDSSIWNLELLKLPVIIPTGQGIVRTNSHRRESLAAIVAHHADNCRCSTCITARHHSQCRIMQAALAASPAQLLQCIQLYRDNCHTLDLQQHQLTPLLIVSKEGMYMDANQAACQHLELNYDDIVGKFVWELRIAPDWRMRNVASQKMLLGQLSTIITHERVKSAASGKVTWMRQTMVAQSRHIPDVKAAASLDDCCPAKSTFLHYAMIIMQPIDAPDSGAGVVVTV